MRHHETSIVGPDLDGPYPIDNRSPFRKAWDETNSPETPDSCPDPYPPDVLAAIPWAKEAGLELKQVSGTWVFLCDGKFYCQFSMKWSNGHTLCEDCGHPTRADALKSPPPTPPGFVEAKVPESSAMRCDLCGWKVERIEVGPGENPQWRCPSCHKPPAQPSVGERLAQVLYHAYTGCITQQPGAHWEKAALAVRREVLKEPWAEEDIQAADTAFQASPGLESRRWVVAALSAALASRVKRAEREGKR